MKKLLILLLFARPALAQPLSIPSDHYKAFASTTAMTIQAPACTTAACAARQITFGDIANGVAGATVYCASASTATISWNGTAATTTAGTELKLPGTFAVSGATVWTASNVGTGTVGEAQQIAAGGTISFTLSWFRLGTQGTAQNLTITTNNTCTIAFNYSAS